MVLGGPAAVGLVPLYVPAVLSDLIFFFLTVMLLVSCFPIVLGIFSRFFIFFFDEGDVLK